MKTPFLLGLAFSARVDEIVKQITPPNGWVRYFQYDARGHCIFQTEASGDLIEQYKLYRLWAALVLRSMGNNLAHSPWGNRFLVTGRESSELGSREMDGQAGRPSERARASQWLSDLRIYDYRNRL